MMTLLQFATKSQSENQSVLAKLRATLQWAVAPFTQAMACFIASYSIQPERLTHLNTLH